MCKISTMKNILIVLLLTVLFVVNSLSQTKSFNGLGFEGVYRGKNIVIKNPYGKGGIGFCVSEVKVNGKTTKDEINATMFQVKLDELGLKLGEKIRVEFIFQDGCTPSPEPMIVSLGALHKPEAGKDAEMIIVGKFFWSNLFLTNPKMADGNYSIKQIKVNDEVLPLNLKSDVVEVTLTKMGLRDTKKLMDGAEVIIDVIYNDGYDPLILNPEAVK